MFKLPFATGRLPVFEDRDDQIWLLKRKFYNGPFGLVSEVFHTHLLEMMNRNVVKNKLGNRLGLGCIMSKAIQDPQVGGAQRLEALYSLSSAPYHGDEKWFPNLVLEEYLKNQDDQFGRELARLYQDHSLVQVLDTMNGNNIEKLVTTKKSKIAPMLDFDMATAFIEGEAPNYDDFDVPLNVDPIGIPPNLEFIRRRFPDLDEEFREAALSLLIGSKKHDYQELCDDIACKEVTDFLRCSVFDDARWNEENKSKYTVPYRSRKMSERVKEIYDGRLKEIVEQGRA